VKLFLTSRLLSAAGIAHGFSLRWGGVSSGPFSSLNLSASVGDDEAAVRENHELLREAAGLTGRLAADGAVGVRVADCVPILVHAGAAAAAVHAGWRGTRLQIAGRAIRALQHAAGADPARMLAAIGPCIGRCCYEVSQDLAATFRALFGPEAADDPAVNPKPHLDLRYCVEQSLLHAGVPRERIEQVEGCTSCDSGAFFSHRRDKGRTGRHLAFIEVRDL